MREKTGILIFSRSTDIECSVKKFDGNQSFFESQKERLENLCSKTGLDTIWYNEHLQVGGNFGERFCNSISSVFSKGYNSLIIIGNDSPQLKYYHLQSSIDSLQSGRVSLGKSFDGGFYLLAIKKQHFNYPEFLNLSWNTSKVSSEIIQLLQTKAKVSFISTLKDVDNQLDFSSLLNFSKQLYTDVILILKRIQKFFDFNFQNPSLFNEKIIFGSFQNKAPPILSRVCRTS
ncbi:DUF2064 domain-containing protein [Psychroflexus salinarum]|uniref:DUF2064 domain-containing protein n=1 Tax=Psychroflexus salinarum TaxID=546024 RepID=A0ABW3GUB4_9FLAO